jgi:hypothetical protein
MADEDTQGTGTGAGNGSSNLAAGAGGSGSASGTHQGGGGGGSSGAPDLNVTAGTSAANGVPGKPGGAGEADNRSPEELLAEAAKGDGKGDPLAKAQADLADWKAKAREWEKRSKANAEKAKSYDEYTESQKTEQQRLADQLAAAQEETRKAHEERFRLLACAQYDLPPELIPHLGGGSEDEINERAEAFAAAINSRAAVLAAAQAPASGQQQQGRPGDYRPVESLRPGALPAGDGKPADPNAWLRRQLSSKK